MKFEIEHFKAWKCHKSWKSHGILRKEYTRIWWGFFKINVGMLHPLHKVLCVKMGYDLHATLLISQGGNFSRGVKKFGHGIVMEFS